ncbi:MAG: hypothetical protein IPP63_11045 [Chloracidobacterium sp.]|nr:hypothetical protein [Chloracidobacterium sp.]
MVSVAACVAFSFAAIFSNTDGSRISAAARPSATPAKAVAATRALEFTDGEFDGKELIKTDAEWKKSFLGRHITSSARRVPSVPTRAV